MALRDLKIDTTSEESVQDSFQKIAERILYNTVLIINDNHYYLTDIEFYYDCPSHPDTYTLPHCVEEIGVIRPHEYGVDISLGSNLIVPKDGKLREQRERQKDFGFGGILIRGMIKNETEAIYKPQVWQEIISSLKQIKDEKNLIYFDTKSNDSNEKPPIKVARFGLGKPDNDENNSRLKSKYENKEYRFISPSQIYFSKLKGKTLILNKSDLKDKKLINELAGYNLIK